jgi:uncharacterized protein YraI
MSFTLTHQTRRRTAGILVPFAAALAAAAMPAAASAGPVFPTASDDPSGLVMHATPSRDGARVGRIPAGGSVEVLCQTTGSQESDPKYGTSSIWDQVKFTGDGTVGFVTDLYVLSNQDHIAGVGACGGAAPAPGPGPAPGPSDGARPSWVPAQYWPILTGAAAKEGLNARLLAAQLKIESQFRTSVCSESGACGIAQFLPSTWQGSWNPYRDQAGPKGYNNPTFAIPAQARYMHLRLATARTKNAGAIRARLARRKDVPAATLNAINFNDPYQIALMSYHGGWDLEGWGPRTSKYPVNIVAQARIA